VWGQGLVEVVYNAFQALLYSTIVFFMVGFDINAGAVRVLVVYSDVMNIRAVVTLVP
jgi:hypothetical protein